jgi:hypothetical protein
MRLNYYTEYAVRCPIFSPAFDAGSHRCSR